MHAPILRGSMEGFTGVVAFTILARLFRRKTRRRAQPNLLQRMGILSGVRQSRELSKDEVFQELKRLGLVSGHSAHSATRSCICTHAHAHVHAFTNL